MENKYIYIDESGDIGYTKKSTRYFILTSLMVEDTFVLGRIAKSVYKIKTDKNKCNMIHAYNVAKIFLARRDTRTYYNNKIVDIFHSYNLNLEFSTPSYEKSLQIADFYSWCIFSKIEYGNSEYFSKLEHQIKIIKLR